VSEYHHSGHAVWEIKYHLVWITKYRYKVLRGEVAERARDLLRGNNSGGYARVTPVLAAARRRSDDDDDIEWRRLNRPGH
jgi:hypothetical protein